MGGPVAVGGTLAGGPLVRRRAAFTADGTRLAVCSGDVVRLYNAATGAPLRELAGHGGEVTLVAAPPGGSNALYSAGGDGTLRLWDADAGDCLRTLEAPGGVESVAFAPAPSPLAFLSCHKPGSDAGRIVVYHLARGKVVDTLGKTTAPTPLVISAPGRYLASFERQTVSVWAVGSLTSSAAGPAHGAPMPASLRLHHTKVITALALCPREERLAAGDATGRILIWHGFGAAAEAVAARGGGGGGAPDATGAPLQPSAHQQQQQAFDKDKRVPLATMHWHSQAVGCVAFTPDGTHLLSGGAEAVLVLWRLDNGTRQYLPRCGGPLRSIAQSPADAAVVALACGDNAHRVVNIAALRCEATVAGARPARLRGGGGGAGGAGGGVVVPAPVWDARTRCVVLAGAGGVLQWYDVARDAAVALLPVAEGAAVAPPPPPPADAGGAAPVEPHVAHFCLGAGGASLATVDARAEAGAGHVTETLRFWELPMPTAAASSAADHADGNAPMQLDDDSGGGGVGGGAAFRLNTRVVAPHRGRVAALAHHPGARAAATASGEAADFRIWLRGGGRAGPTAAWRCRSVGFYQGRPMCALAFSSDGSVLAVGAGDAATLWSPATNALLAVLHPPSGFGVALSSASTAEAASLTPPPLTHLAFLDGTGEPLLAGVSCGSERGAFSCWRVAAAGGPGCVARHHAPLHATAFAADARRAAVAIAVRPPPGSGRPAGAVLSFGGGEGAAPRAAWALGPASAPPALLYVPTAAVPTAPATSDATSEALLVCTEERRFALAAAAEAGAVAATQQRLAAPAGALAAPASGFTATFGPLRAPEAPAARAGGGAARGGGGAWRPIVDAPSHALPSLLSLLPAYMDALLRETEPPGA